MLFMPHQLEVTFLYRRSIHADTKGQLCIQMFTFPPSTHKKAESGFIFKKNLKDLMDVWIFRLYFPVSGPEQTEENWKIAK